MMLQQRPLYEGDGYFHDSGNRPAGQPAETGSVSSQSAQPPGAELGGKPQAFRAEPLRAWFPKALHWAHERIRYARMCEAERYLAQATDLADLERRLQEATRKGMTFSRC